ncbi:hypothetical protein HDU91_003522, partial [Kappamyces sp. JEL0680]
MTAASLAIEAFSILGWWTGFKSCNAVISQSTAGPSPSEPNMIAILGGGAISGLIVAGVGLPRKDVRLWPETLQERRLLAPGSTQFQTLKLAASHALFWTVYS